jgi:NADPH-dependent F420 reductase
MNKTMPGPIAIVGGTGAEGFGLALRFAHAGATVHIGSRDLARAQAAAQRIRDSRPGAAVAGSLNPDAVTAADIVILTVPLAAQVETLESVRASFRPGAILVDATVPLKSTLEESAAQQAARHVPEGVAVVAGFQSLDAKLLADLERPTDTDVFLCGDSAEAKAAVREVVAMLPGARAVDGGALKNSRFVESMVALLISLNVRKKARHAGVRITGLEPGF